MKIFKNIALFSILTIGIFSNLSANDTNDVNWIVGNCVGLLSAAKARGIELPQISPRGSKTILEFINKNKGIGLLNQCQSTEKTDSCMDKLNITNKSERNFIKGYVGGANLVASKSVVDIQSKFWVLFCDPLNQ
jgi:hypothetical protein